MKNTSLYYLLVVAFFCSCNTTDEETEFFSNDMEGEILSDEGNNNNHQNNSEDYFILLDNADAYPCTDSEVYNPYFTGTACCVSRATELELGEPVTYVYASNLGNVEVTWEVFSDEMEIVETSSNSITVIFKVDFLYGRILGTGFSTQEGLSCGDYVIINKKINPNIL